MNGLVNTLLDIVRGTIIPLERDYFDEWEG